MNKTDFLEYVKNFCSEKGIDFKPYEGKTAYTVMSNMECNGFFEENETITPTLGIATELEDQMFYEVLAHEFSHVQQYLEKSPFWSGSRLSKDEVKTYSSILKKDITGWETGDLFNAWLEKEVELCPIVLGNIVDRTTGVEFDCERRTLQLAKEMNLEISQEEYAQKANGYLLTYFYALKTRSWTSPGHGPSMQKIVYSQLPTQIDPDFCRNITPELIELIKAHCVVENWEEV